MNKLMVVVSMRAKAAEDLDSNSSQNVRVEQIKMLIPILDELGVFTPADFPFEVEGLRHQLNTSILPTYAL